MTSNDGFHVVVVRCLANGRAYFAVTRDADRYCSKAFSCISADNSEFFADRALWPEEDLWRFRVDGPFTHVEALAFREAQMRALLARGVSPYNNLTRNFLQVVEVDGRQYCGVIAAARAAGVSRDTASRRYRKRLGA